ncbi:hypothetical protein QJQ45_026578, partial [Haematococcus lacustris]
MVHRRRIDASVDGMPDGAPSAIPRPLSGTSLTTLPIELKDDIARRAIQLGAGEALSLTCRACSKTNLLHAPSLHIQLDSQGCDQFLTPRVVAALQARTCKLALTLEQQRAQSSREYIMLLTEVLKKLANHGCEKKASCAAVETCKLGTIQGPSPIPRSSLCCSPDLAQHLLDSFPSLTSLGLHGYSIPCSDLGALLSHPQLSLQLQQLDLSNTTIIQAKRPEPGAATLDNLFHASRLKQLSLFIKSRSEGNKLLLPDLQPLSQHLTQLRIQQGAGVPWGLDEFTAAMAPLAQLQVLAMPGCDHMLGLLELLQALPQLHTLQLPDAAGRGQEQLDTLLAATQLTSIKLKSVTRLTSARADAPCSWQRLELTGYVDCSFMAHLPLHSLTQPLVLGTLQCNANDLDLVAAAVNNLTQACKVPVMIKVLRLTAWQHVKVQQLLAVLQPLKHRSWGMVSVTHMNVGAAEVSTLAPLCQACTQLEFAFGSVNPSLDFWHQLVQEMPTITHLTFFDSKGSDSAAMCKSLKLMADQPWARWLDVCIARPSCSDRLHACWRDSLLSQLGKLRAPSAEDELVPATTLLELPAALLDDIAHRLDQSSKNSCSSWWLCCKRREAVARDVGVMWLAMWAMRVVGQQTAPAMSQRDMQHQVAEDGSASAADGYSPAGEAPPPATRLLDLPPALLDDIACRVMQLGARSLLPLTCRAFSQARLLHVPALRIQLGRPHCDELLMPRVVATLQARKSKLALTLWQPETVDSMHYIEQLAPTLQLPQTEYTQHYTDLLAHALAKLDNCAAVEVCKLVCSGEHDPDNHKHLRCPPGLPQHLLDSFPSLTALTLQGFCVSSDALASLLSHPPLARQLQQLDLANTSVMVGNKPRAVGTLFHMFQGLQLKQLSIAIQHRIPGTPPLPSFQPLAQHLTQLHLDFCSLYNGDLKYLVEYFRPLAQLQVLTLPYQDQLEGLAELLQALPLLHTLQLPLLTVRGQQQLNTLLAATQITSLQLRGVTGLDALRADVPCSWQRLELSGAVEGPDIMYLPLHSLSQPLVLGQLQICVEDIPDPEVAAALHLLAEAIKVPVQIKEVQLVLRSPEQRHEGITPALLQQQRVDLAQLVALLQPLQCCGKVVVYCLHEVDLADVLALAPVCRDCTHFVLSDGSMDPSLEFWRQLVHLMPAVYKVDLIPSSMIAGSAADITVLAPLRRACTRIRFRSGITQASLYFWQQLVQLMPAVQQVTFWSQLSLNITVTLATWDAVWEVYLDLQWARQWLRLELLFQKLEEEMAEVSMERHKRVKQLVVFFGAAGVGTRGGRGADAVLRAGCKVVSRSRGTSERLVRVVLVVAPRILPQPPCSQAASQPAASEPGPNTPPPAKCTKAEQAAEPTQQLAINPTNLLHAPTLHIQLDSQRCDQFLTPRVVAALQARTCKLVLTLEQQRAQSSRQYLMLLTEVLKKLAGCAAVEACKLGTMEGPSLFPRTLLGFSRDLAQPWTLDSRLHLDFSSSLAQYLTDSFPSMTSLSLLGYAIPCSSLASMLSHPQLNLQLQQLDLTGTIITQPKRPEPGAATLANLFHASRLKQLSLLISSMADNESNDDMVEGENTPLLPNLQPLSQHLTQLCLTLPEGVAWRLDEFTAALQPLAQLQVLTISNLWYLELLSGLLQALPQLHTLQLPDAKLCSLEDLDALLAATQLTSIQLNSLDGLPYSCADVPCSWQRLELTGCVDCISAAHLPLHTLTQPLMLGALSLRIDEGDDCDLVAAAVHNLTQACSVPVRIVDLWLYMSEVDMAAEQQVELQPLVAALQALKHCSWERVSVTNMIVGAADISTLAPLCQGCTQLEFSAGGVTPSLEFWHHLLQLMPTVTHLTFSNSKGSDSAAMHQSLQLMADQPWARWLDICIEGPLDSDRLDSFNACTILDDNSFVTTHIEPALTLCLTVVARQGQQTAPAMSQRDMQHHVAVDGGASATDRYGPAGEAPPPATRLLDLPPALLDYIACRVMQLGARSLLPLTCRAFSQAHLRHVPSLRIQLCRPRCDQQLTPRIIAALRARRSKLALTFEPQTQTQIEALVYVLAHLGSCVAVDAIKLSCSLWPLDCTPELAQSLVDSFPSLTALGLQGFSVTCSDLASLLAHPLLALQLQQLDLTRTAIQQPQQHGPGLVTLDNLFQGARLNQLSLYSHNIDEGEVLFPSLKPLAQHLTHLSLLDATPSSHTYCFQTVSAQRLAHLRELCVCSSGSLEGLPELLQALPQLHTLQLPGATVQDQHLDTLLAATQITSVQFGIVHGL